MSLTDLFRKVVLIKESLGLLKFVFLFLIIGLIFVFKGVPWWLSSGFFLIGLLFILLHILQLKRIKDVNLEERQITSPSEKTSSSKKPMRIRNEQVIHAVFGIMRSYRKGYEVLEVGEMSNPENAMIITNKRIIFFAVPVAGEGKSVYDVDFTLMNWLFNKKRIEEKGRKMLENMNPQEILDSYKNNFDLLFEEIKQIKISTFFARGVKFIDIKGNSAKYAIKDKEDLERLKEIFNKYLPGKLR